jgi:hypothetical protein
MAVFSLGERKVTFRGDEWFVAHNATVVGSVVVENQANIWFNAVIRGDNDLITIGEGSNCIPIPAFPSLSEGTSAWDTKSCSMAARCTTAR